jgi:hypothetical protein
MITVGPMALNQPQAADPMEPFFLGTQSGGGYWTDISRLSSHDHSGGLMGAAVAVNIPDGSITAADLDPSVLAPYALVDGSKPFSGLVTMQADAVIRDELLFGPQGSAAAPDVHVLRTGVGALRVDTHLGIAATPEAWATTTPVLRIGQRGAINGAAGQSGLTLRENSYYDGTGERAIAAGAASYVNLTGGTTSIATAPSVAAAGDVQTYTTRLAVSNSGALTITPASGAAALTNAGTAPFTFTNGVALAANARLYASSGLELAAGADVQLSAGSFNVRPVTDNLNLLGHSGFRWTAVYAVAGTINTSSAALKEGITPLSPERAMQAVRDTQPVTFDYVAPTRGPEWYDLPDDPEQAEAVLQQRLTAAPLEAAARHQSGFVAEQCDELFLVGEGQTSPGNSVGVLIAALQHLDSRLAALEGVA